MGKNKQNDEVPVEIQDTGAVEPQAQQEQTSAQEEVSQKPKKPVTQMLVANSREEMADAFETLKAQNPDKTLMAGAVGQKDDGTFELKVDFVN